MKENFKAMKEIFEAFWSKHIVNVVIIFAIESNTEIQLFTYYPFTASNCENIIPTLLNRFKDNKFLSPIKYFPVKLKNFYGCPVSIVTFQAPPFMIFQWNKNGSLILDGIDGIVVKLLAEQLNFRVVLHEEPHRLGKIFENGTVTG